MRHPLATIIPLSAALLLGSLATSARSATTILHDFTGGTSDGYQPLGSLTLSGSKLYGMTSLGGSSDAGAIFSMNPDGTNYGLLHSFAGASGDGAFPYGSLTISDSKLYGMAPFAGNNNGGTLFSMNTDGTGFNLLRIFTSTSDGRSPLGSLTLSGSKLYGMTQYGGNGDLNGPGTIFSIDTDGTGFSVIHRFNAGATDGGYPGGSLTLSGTILYGMTQTGGSSGNGIVFSMDTNGTGFSLLHSFTGGTGDGANPLGSLTLSGSKLYGMTEYGGGSDTGTIFSMNMDGTGFSLLRSFTGGGTDGASPLGSLTLSGSTLYGMTNKGGSSDAGTLFSINTDGTAFSLLESFAGSPADGSRPGYGDVIFSADASALYATTISGGAADRGVVFAKSLVPEPGAFALLGFGTFLLSTRRRDAKT